MNVCSEPVVWPFPLPRTHTGIALANGNVGALVWGGKRLCITLNRSDFWDHRNGEVVPEWASYERVKAAVGQPDVLKQMTWIFNDPENLPPKWKSSRLPFGRFEFGFRLGIVPRQAALSVSDGILRVALSDGSLMELAVAMDAPVLVVSDPTDAIEHVVVRTAWEWCDDGLRQRGLPEATMFTCDDPGWVQELPEDPAMAALCQAVSGGRVIALSRGEGAFAAMTAAKHACEDHNIASTLDSTQRWWRDYAERLPTVELPDHELSRLLHYCLYRFGAATTPGGHPAGLQGPWGEEYQMIPWNGDYHYNVNIQQIYTLAVQANHPEHLLPLFDMLESEPYQRIMRQTARRLFGIEDGLVLTHAMDDRGHQVGGLSVASVLDQACAGWMAHLYWLYYQYTGDEAFLRERAWPFMRSVMQAFAAMLELKDGHYRMPVSISAEYRAYNPEGAVIRHGSSPSYQLACIHMVLGALLQACDILGEPPEPAWCDIQARLPRYTSIDSTEGPRIAIWEGQDLDQCHRHHSHLACIYPFDSLGPVSEEDTAVVERSLDRWISMGMGEWSEWGFPWAAILQVRSGLRESPVALLELWRKVFVNEGLTTGYLPLIRGITNHQAGKAALPREQNEIMQLDGTSGFASAILELLCHVHQGVIRIFAGIPESWRDVVFRNLPLPGPLHVSAVKKAGRFSSAELVSDRGGSYTLMIEGEHNVEVVIGTTSECLELPGEIELSPGGRAILRSMQVGAIQVDATRHEINAQASRHHPSACFASAEESGQ